MGGAISFPAAYDIVIGVTSSDVCTNISDIEFIQNSVINIAAKGHNQKIAWTDPLYIVSAGNSFACAHVSGIISNLLAKNIKNSDILFELKKNSLYVRDFDNKSNKTDSCCSFVPQKAVVFPFNKEIHSIIRFKELLDFKIVDVYDTKYSAKISASTNQLLNTIGSPNFLIKNIETLNWDSFDTFILGHIGELKSILNKKLNIDNLILELINHNKFIFSLEDISAYKQNIDEDKWKNQVFIPHISDNDIVKRPYGKLYRHNKPVLCVCGTSSKQGKFTLQLNLRRKFINAGYNIGQLGTEPTSTLFGMDECFHYGYHSNIAISRHNTIAYLNDKMYQISNKNIDIILTGSQSGVITQYEGNLLNYPLGQYEFLLGVQPDIVILCINPFDPLCLIERAIKFIEGGIDCKVIALVIYPKGSVTESVSLGHKNTAMSETYYQSLSNELLNRFSLPVYRLDDENHLDSLFNYIVEYLS